MGFLVGRPQEESGSQWTMVVNGSSLHYAGRSPHMQAMNAFILPAVVISRVELNQDQDQVISVISGEARER